MESPVRPSAGARRRIWIAAVAVSGIVSVTTAVSAVALGNDEPKARAWSQVTAAPQAQRPLFTLPDVDWKLSWHDEFDGTGRPASHWTPVLGGGTRGWSHRALQYYVAGASRLDGEGRLVLSAVEADESTRVRCWYGRCKFFSGRIQTKGSFSQAYGRFAVRAKMPTGQGIWPAFWMQGDTLPYGEIDVVETIGSRPNTVQGWAHTNRRIGGGEYNLAEPLSSDYHVYGVDWTPNRVVWWVDGRPYAQAERYRGWTLNKPFYLILNLQVGGSWPGPPDATTRFPARLIVDWVRVYKG